MPYPTVANTIKEVNRSAELVGENLVLGQIRDVLQPTVDKAVRCRPTSPRQSSARATSW